MSGLSGYEIVFPDGSRNGLGADHDRSISRQNSPILIAMVMILEAARFSRLDGNDLHHRRRIFRQPQFCAPRTSISEGFRFFHIYLNQIISHAEAKNMQHLPVYNSANVPPWNTCGIAQNRYSLPSTNPVERSFLYMLHHL